MTFVTRLTFRSGDRAALEDAVADLKAMLERKGAECRGPHQEQPERLTLPRYATLSPGEEFEGWDYTVYTRWLEIHGSDHIAQQVGRREYPDGVHVEIEVEQRTTQGHHT
jgi:ribosomal protein S10